MENSVKRNIVDHCELMVEEALNRLNKRNVGFLDLEGEWEDGRDQGIKDACRIILLVVKDHEND